MPEAPKHTPEPLIGQPDIDLMEITTPDLTTVAEMVGNNERATATMYRLVDCYNACKGIHPEAVPLMREALKNIENDDGRIPSTIWTMINDAIAKAKSST